MLRWTSALGEPRESGEAVKAALIPLPASCHEHPDLATCRLHHSTGTTLGPTGDQAPDTGIRSISLKLQRHKTHPVSHPRPAARSFQDTSQEDKVLEQNLSWLVCNLFSLK